MLLIVRAAVGCVLLALLYGVLGLSLGALLLVAYTVAIAITAWEAAQELLSCASRRLTGRG